MTLPKKASTTKPLPLAETKVPLLPPPARFPVVALGASAGGLAAFEAFFSALPDTPPGMAFVLVQHLAPDFESSLAELMRKRTRLPVLEVQDGMVLQVNTVFVMPPNCDMALINGTLQLLPPSTPRGLRLPVDFFMTSLAQSLQELAVAVVLSGTGSDGTLGLRAIKRSGGLVLVQTPESADFDGMPHSALATELADFVLPPASMPAPLMAFAARALLPANRPTFAPTPHTENALKKIFVLLRAHTSHDFSQYKPSTIYRRIERRMAVHQLDTIEGYVKHLQQTPAEVQALFRDLLIGVTNFFRDPEAFGALEEQIIPRLLSGKSPGAAVRVWTTGCSTGVEAYSIAILLQERMEQLQTHFKVQIFATDIDSQAIGVARAGLYPANIASDISPARLARFFTPELDGSGYRIHKGIRDMLVFSEHDMIKDPPFSKLDLISCRNVLIYMGAELQKKLIPLFHYALNPGGLLFLGTSETVGEFGDLFEPLDRKSKLYLRKDDIHGAHRVALGRFLPPMVTIDATFTPMAPKTPRTTKQPLRELTEQTLLQQVGLVAALVNHLGDILYLHGRSGMYLELAPGEAGINNILKMAREGLRRDLTTALHQATSTREVVRVPGLQVRTNGHFTRVNLTVRPVAAGTGSAQDSPLYLVVLEEAAPDAQPVVLPPPPALDMASPGLPLDTDERIAVLKQALWAKEEHLQAANEELETSNEELKSSNEEMQSVNEELQSTNEELETSKEELQSVNEELGTVNAELQTKVADLWQANNDMNNLLAGSGVATVFVDHELRILRYTPAATRIINLIPSDVGRPVAHVVSNLVGYDRLVADTQAVLNTLMTQEITVQAVGNVWYTMRILPYRTLDNVIEGAVITFVDVTALKLAEASLREATQALDRLAVVVRDASDAITVQDLTGRTLAWNPGAVRLYGWTEAEALTLNVRERMPPALRGEGVARIQQLSQSDMLAADVTQRLTKQGEVLEVSVTSTALINEAGQLYAIATTERAAKSKTGPLAP